MLRMEIHHALSWRCRNPGSHMAKPGETTAALIEGKAMNAG